MQVSKLASMSFQFKIEQNTVYLMNGKLASYLLVSTGGDKEFVLINSRKEK